MAAEFQPYIGPQPFDTTDSSRFFGRDREADQILSMVVARREVLLYSQSGAGKTSILNAKLRGLFQEEGFDILPLARVYGPLPKGIAASEISNPYVFNVISAWAAAEGKSPNEHVTSTLSEYLRSRPRLLDNDRESRPQLIILDQFEELFSAYADRTADRLHFFLQLADALKSDPTLRLLLSMKEDCIAEIEAPAHNLSDRLRTRFRLERLGREAALAAITGPLSGTDVKFEAGVAERLVNDLSNLKVESFTGETVEIQGDYVEPVQLQVVCQSLWNELPSDVRTITHQQLDIFGDVTEALARFYEKTINIACELSGVSERDLRVWCEKWLITSSGTRSLVHRGRSDAEGMPNSALTVLESQHLIRAEQRAGTWWFELCHDRFIEPIRRSNRKWEDLLRQRAVSASILLRKAETSIEKDEALELAREAADLYDQTAEFSDRGLAWLKLALLLQQLESPEARAAYLEVVQRAMEIPEPQVALYLLYQSGRFFHDIEDYELALDCFSRSIKVQPNDHRSYARRAASYWYSGKHSEALRDYSEALRLVPQYYHAYNSRGQVYAEMGEYKRALEDLERSINFAKPDNDITMEAYSRNGLGLAYAGLGQYSQALKQFKLSMDVCPNNAWVFYNRAQTYEMMRKPRKAAEDYRTALEKTDPPLTKFKRQRAEARLLALTEKS